MRRTARAKLDGEVIVDDLSLFQGLVVKSSEATTHSRIQALAWSFVMIAYAICDLADASQSASRWSR